MKQVSFSLLCSFLCLCDSTMPSFHKGEASVYLLLETLCVLYLRGPVTWSGSWDLWDPSLFLALTFPTWREEIPCFFYNTVRANSWKLHWMICNKNTDVIKMMSVENSGGGVIVCLIGNDFISDNLNLPVLEILSLETSLINLLEIKCFILSKTKYYLLV